MTSRYFLALVIALVSLMTHAQDDLGRWTLHPVFASENITNCIDTGDKVYYLVSGSLFCYDKETQENEHLSRTNYLNDTGVSNIYYNATKHYIMVAYTNSNIDVIDVESGQVDNISDIKNASLATSKAINDITFASGNMAVVATDFGFVILNDSKHEVISSFINEQPFSSAMMIDTYLMVAQGNYIYYAPASHHIQQMSDFKRARLGVTGSMIPLDDNKFLVLASDALYLATATVAGDEINFSTSRLAQGQPLAVSKTRDGNMVVSFKDSDYFYTIDAASLAATRHDGSGIYTSYESDGSWWVLDREGLHNIKEGAAITNVKPSAISIASPLFWMTYDTYQDHLMLTSSSDNAVLDHSADAGPTRINTYDGFAWKDITPADVPQPDEGMYWPVVSPNEANTYFYSTRKLGVVKVTDGKIVSRYSIDNCETARMVGLRFDSQGNLWMAESRNEAHPVRVLTPAKQAKTNVTTQDFIENNSAHIKNMFSTGFKRTQFAIGSGDTKVFASGEFEQPIVIWNNNSDLSLNRSISFASGALTDQDGKNLQWQQIRCLTPDKNGLVWMATTTGVICFNPSRAFDADFRVNHIKVPRNDGTDLADYLLDGQTINCIAVDGANRKWIGTDASGLFLVSEDGQQVLKNFNATNSVMGSNQIFQVCCDPTSNSVYVTTPLGLAEYKSDATPGEASFSNISAYPNPVRPDYGGPINITGLMENSLIKIADPSGNVIRTLKSTGGMVSWDTCNENGDLVGTGVYTILASHAGGSGGGTTKVLIVR